MKPLYVFRLEASSEEEQKASIIDTLRKIRDLCESSCIVNYSDYTLLTLDELVAIDLYDWNTLIAEPKEHKPHVIEAYVGIQDGIYLQLYRIFIDTHLYHTNIWYVGYSDVSLNQVDGVPLYSVTDKHISEIQTLNLPGGRNM